MKVLVQTKIFGPDTVKGVMNGGHYNHSKKSLNIFLLSLRLTLTHFSPVPHFYTP